VAFVATPTSQMLHVDGNVLATSQGCYDNLEHRRCQFAQIGTGLVTGLINPNGECCWRPFDGDLRNFHVWAAALSTEDIRAAIESPLVRVEALLCDFPFYGSVENVYAPCGDGDAYPLSNKPWTFNNESWKWVLPAVLPCLTPSGPADSAIFLRCVAPIFVDQSKSFEPHTRAVRATEAAT